MYVLLSAVAFFFLLSFLILIHEAGHFFAARRSGVIVEEFGFGLPPRAKTLFVAGGTRFSLNWIPFGGFVRLKGENAVHEADRRMKGNFAAAPYRSRILILVAGVAMNFFLSLLIFVGGFSAGGWIPTYVSYEDLRSAAARGEVMLSPGVVIESVLPEGPAARAGVAPQGLLIAVDGVTVYSPAEVAPLQKDKEEVRYTVRTGPDVPDERDIVVPVEDGKTGIALGFHIRGITSPSRSLVQGGVLAVREASVMTVQTVLGIGKLFQSLFLTARVPEGITGIIGIAQMTHASVREGWSVYMRLLAELSLGLAALNILPVPALDGGRLMFVLLEMVRRKPVNRTFEVLTNAVGFVFLILLILVITYHDVLRLF